MSTNWQELTRSYLVWDDNNIKGFFGWKKGEYAWLSNFYKSTVWYDGICYSSVENAYQAQKVQEQFRDIFCDITPAQSKLEWQKYSRVDKDAQEWDNRKYDVMLYCVFDKFWRNKDLKKKLLDTDNKYLEELNHWKDVFWGVDYKTGLGENNLGKILMKVREVLR